MQEPDFGGPSPQPPERPPSANGEDIRRHLEWLIAPARGAYDDALFEIAWDGEGRGPTHARLFPLFEVREAVALAMERNGEGRNVYVGAALRLPDAARHKRGSAEDFYVATAVPIDIDKEHDAVHARLVAVCEEGLVVVTGLTPERRSQHWARLVEPCDDDQAFAEAFAALVLHTGGDPKVKDSARLMRLGGTVSFPDARKQGLGYRVELTSVVINDGARASDVERLRALAPHDLVGQATRSTTRAGSPAEIGRDDHGRIVDGRETHFRNLLLKHLRAYQNANGADPDEMELWRLAFGEFADSGRVDHADERWTSESGKRLLEARLRNTLRRLRLGRLAAFGLYSIETGAGRDEAERARSGRHRGAAVSPEARDISSDAGAGRYTLDPWERFVVPPFPRETLPGVVRSFVDYSATTIGADVNGLALAALVACSGAISHDFRLKMARTGDWHVRPRLWGLLVGDPSNKKTPIMNAATAPLQERDVRAVEAWERRRAAWLEAVELKEAKKSDEPPRPARALVHDTTVEKLAEILAREERGTLVFRDELAGWIGSMEKYSGKGAGAADRGFWLKSYDGGRYTVDRVSSGERVVSNFSVSFLAGIQPDRLAELGNMTSDGLLQRFVPVMLGKPVLPREVNDDAPAAAYGRLLNYLAELRAVRLLCDSGALEITRDLQVELHDLEQSGASGKGFTGFVGKLMGVYGSLVLVLHLAGDPESGRERPVEQGAAAAARRIVRDFIIPHALEFYRAADDHSDGEVLRLIASYLLTSDATRFRASDFTASLRSLRGLSLWELQRKLSPLIAGGWLHPEDDTPGCRAWRLETCVRETFAARAATERLRREAVHSYLLQFQGRAA